MGDILMDFWSISGIILSSSLVTALLTKLADLWIHKDKYKKEYYKLVLQRRLKAYELIDEYISNFGTMTMVENKLCPTFMFLPDSFDILFVRMAEIKKQSLWYSSDLDKKLSTLNELLYNISTRKENGEHLEKIGLEILEELRDIRDGVSDSIRKDLLDLYDVKGFLNKKSDKQMNQLNLIKDK
jgi:hypothetical protein